MTPQERAAAFVQAWMKQSTYTTESFIVARHIAHQLTHTSAVH